MTDQQKLELSCPCCEATLVVDRLTGEILWHKEKTTARRSGSIEEIMSQMEAKKSEAEKRFERELESQKDRGRILDEKFKEALQRADKSKTPPINPFDLD
jgi:hypothetical protein